MKENADVCPGVVGLVISNISAYLNWDFQHCPVSLVALSLAMNRDGSSGGVAYIVTIGEHNTEEKVILGNDLPTFFDQ